MLRRFYRWLVRFHPAAFRNRFGEEMLSIFDQSANNRETARLLIDGFTSLLRQWVARPEYLEEPVSKPIECASNGAPVLFILGDYRPRTGPLISGGFVAVIVFCAAWFVSEYTWTHPVFMPFRTVPADTAYGGQSESADKSPLPLASIPSQQAPVARGSRIALPAEPAALSRPTPTQSSSSSASPSQTPAPSSQREAAPTAPILRPESAENGGTTVSADRAIRPTTVPPADEAILQSYVGVYAAPNVQVAITVEDGKLMMQIRGETKTMLVPAGAGEFMIAGSRNGSVKFLKDQTGTVHEVEVSRAGWRLSARRTPTKTPNAAE